MNGNFNNYGYQGGYIPNGYIYQPSQTKLNMTQGLTPEQLKSLRKTGGFSLEISQEELLKSYCTHRQDNKFTVTQDEEGNFICSLCGTKFKSFDGNVAEARDLVEKVVDLMETTKMQALNLPPKTIQNFFQIEPVLRRLPDLFAQSCNDYKNALGTDNYIYGQERNAFVQYQQIMNPMGGNNYYDPATMNMQQPMYGAQPAMYQQPYPNYGDPMMNNMQQPMYGQPDMMNQQPMVNNMQPMYNGNGQMQNPFNSNNNPVPPVQTTNNNQSNDVKVSKQLTD